MYAIATSKMTSVMMLKLRKYSLTSQLSLASEANPSYIIQEDNVNGKCIGPCVKTSKYLLSFFGSVSFDTTKPS